ncbi:MAG: type II toxin-antitoxin system VapC family toxin [Acidobacteriota bacterium]
MEKNVIFDTDILIDNFRGIKEAKDFLNSFRKENRFITAISVMEIFRGARNKNELSAFKLFFYSAFKEIIYVNERICQFAVELILNYSISHGILLPDAFIASTSMIREMELITRNVKHFNFILGIKLSYPPYKSQ